jgi:hypothetical protein
MPVNGFALLVCAVFLPSALLVCFYIVIIINWWHRFVALAVSCTPNMLGVCVCSRICPYTSITGVYYCAERESSQRQEDAFEQYHIAATAIVRGCQQL